MRRWPFRRREPVRVDIDPVQLVVVNFLLRYKAAPQDTIHDEVHGTLGTQREPFVLALAGLASQGLIEPRYQPESGETWFVLSPLGRRLRGKVPRSSRSALAVFL